MNSITVQSNVLIPDRLEHVLVVFREMTIHPNWEKLWIEKPLTDEINIREQPLYKQVLLAKSYGQYFRANPRTAAYMLNETQHLMQAYFPKAKVDLLIAKSTLSTIEPRSWINKVWYFDPWDSKQFLASQETQYNCILLLYPDAIGAGWGPLEKHLQRLGISPIWVLNGRKRLFLWNKKTQRQLQLRRTFAWLPVNEFIFIIMLSLLGLILAVYDTLRNFLRR